jgi:hypothetical protein
MIIGNRKELVDEVENSLEQVESYQNDMPKVDWAKLHYTYEAHLANLSRLSNAVNALVKAVNAPEPEPAFAPFPAANTKTAEEKRAAGFEPDGTPRATRAETNRATHGDAHANTASDGKLNSAARAAANTIKHAVHANTA